MAPENGGSDANGISEAGKPANHSIRKGAYLDGVGDQRCPTPRPMPHVKRAASRKPACKPASNDGEISAGCMATAVAATRAAEVAAAAHASHALQPGTEPAESDNESDDEEEPSWMAFLPLIGFMAYELAFEAIDSGGIQITIMFLLPLWVGLKKLAGHIWVEIRYGGDAPPPPPGHVAPPFAPPPPPPPDRIAAFMEVLFDFAEARPIIYFCLNFGILFAIGTFFLFLHDIQDWLAKRKAKQKIRESKKKRQGYAELKDEEDEEDAHPDLAAMKKELMRVTDKAEELEIKTRVQRKATDAAAESRAQLKQLQDRRDELKALLSQDGARAPRMKEEKHKEPSLFVKFMRSTFMQVVTNAANGVMTVTLYFADLISDLQVVQLLFDSGNAVWAWMSCAILVAQFIVVYIRVLPYLSTTFGRQSMVFKLFLIFGFPWGCLFLDCLMFLEPFGLLTVLPFPDWVRQFVPAYKATRIIAEVAIESLPQCLLQAYIYIIVVLQAKDGTAPPNIMAMIEFASLLPKSILISTLSTLKTWVELVYGAREAGLTVVAKAVQLWNVGAGLPLDAIQKGAITTWVCPYTLTEVEIMPLLDALGKNASLVHLDLAQSGITWTGANATGMPLIEMLAKSESALGGLQTLVISHESGFKIPVGQLRSPPDVALAALRMVPILSTGGPRREELYFIADILRSNTDVSVVEKAEKAAGEAVIKLRAAARGGKLKRDAWEQSLTQLVTEGATRRGHLQSLISAECLRDVGFKAAELLAVGFDLVELRLGSYAAAELRATGIKAVDMGAAGYSARDLKGGGYTAAALKAANFTAAQLKAGGFVAKQLKIVGFTPDELKANGFSAGELREGTFAAKDIKYLFTVMEMRLAAFSAKQMKNADYTLAELKSGEYPAVELKEANYGGTEMRKAGFGAMELKVAGYSGSEMRIAGFTAAEMRDAGFSAKKLKLAAYSAAETTAAGWAVDVLKGAGYTADDLRTANHTAGELKAVGFTLSELKSAGYSTTELQDVGFGAEELRAAGTSLAELTSAGASVAELKAAGISAIGLKAEAVSLEEMKRVGYTVRELKTANFTVTELHDVGFPAYELTAVGFTAKEVRTERRPNTKHHAHAHRPQP